LVSTT